MGNPGLPDPRVTPRLANPCLRSLFLLTFTAASSSASIFFPCVHHRTAFLRCACHTDVALSSAVSSFRTSPSGLCNPSADLNDIFEGKFRHNRGKHRTWSAFLSRLLFSSPTEEYYCYRCYRIFVPSSLQQQQQLPPTRVNRIRLLEDSSILCAAPFRSYTFRSRGMALT